jgi:hypothetical protein
MRTKARGNDNSSSTSAAKHPPKQDRRQSICPSNTSGKASAQAPSDDYGYNNTSWTNQVRRNMKHN